MLKIINTVEEMKKIVKDAIFERKTIGLVPTMGYLHKGHLSLVERSVKENDITIVSIFVNPIQFGTGEDLDAYPRDLAGDAGLLEKSGAGYVFAPSVNEMYPKGYNTFIYVNKVTEGLCGASRPLHFRGVCTVVAKLFNICTPTRAYFGQKDFQQTVAVRKMIDDLNMDIGMTVCPTVREDDGLAMSSRNTYLTKEQRAVAPVIYKALQTAKEKINSGETSCEDIKKVIADTLRQNKDISIEYIEIRRQKDLAEIEMIVEDAVIAVAVRLGKTRLIDNILVGGRHNEDHCS